MDEGPIEAQSLSGARRMLHIVTKSSRKRKVESIVPELVALFGLESPSSHSLELA
jgi:hypothetical protein